MSITKALSNAMSGLTATARGTETVAGNLANALTPGYARLEVMQSSMTMGGNGGGVRVDGVMRLVNATLLAEYRWADTARSQATTRQAFNLRMENVVGVAGAPGSLGAALSDFQTALQSASVRPDDELRLTQVMNAAGSLANRLNTASAEVQKARTSADQAIALDIVGLNEGLERVAYLNKRISIIDAEGGDPSSLIDERQNVIGEIAKIVPVQEVARDGNKVALFTKEGAALLDGSIPAKIEFASAGQMTPDRKVGAGNVNSIVFNGEELTAGQMRLFTGGSLGANFEIRDELAPKLQQELDALAFDLHERLSGASVDPTLAGGAPGLFTDNGARADVTAIVGLAGRISMNTAVDPTAGGEIWRIRAGIGATVDGAPGDNALLMAMSDALNRVSPSYGGSDFEGNGDLASRFSMFEARVVSRRVGTDTDAAIRNAHAATISSRFLADAVDSDAELQKLLQYEQAYAANARVIQAVDDMMDFILRL